MSYLDPQSWDDVDSAGNPLAWDSRTDKLTFPGYEMLVRALKERFRFTPVQRQPGMIYRQPMTLFWNQNRWRSFFDYRMYYRPTTGDQFIDQDNFRPFTDNAVQDWSDGTVAPSWFTMESMLAAIGDDSFIECTPGSQLRGLVPGWSLQRYKILNKMVWVLNNNWTIQYVEGSTPHMFKYGRGATWADALAAYNAAPWSVVSTNFTTRPPGHYVQFAKDLYDAGSTFAVKIYRRRDGLFATRTDPVECVIRNVYHAEKIIECFLPDATASSYSWKNYYGLLNAGDTINVKSDMGDEYTLTLAAYPRFNSVSSPFLFQFEEEIPATIEGGSIATPHSFLYLDPPRKKLRKMDLYQRCRKPPTIDGSRTYESTYINNDTPEFIEDQYRKIWNDLTEDEVVPFRIGDYEACTLPEPNTAGGNQWYGWESDISSLSGRGFRLGTDGFLIEKMDTPGVFRFTPPPPPE